ncbi:VIT domain-containing protein [Undibacterium sp.]|uniref:VIT domain-containing protein n=1 Tax=Undibacterium sp. TaxID=1914977 RepID=UPI00374DCBDB
MLQHISRGMVSALLAITAALAGTPAHALTPAPKGSLITTINGEQPIQLQSLQLKTDINGRLAETTVEMVFFNPNPRQLEGNLQFPLQEGQQITGFALDMEGALRPAVPVEKAKGRQVFEAIERRRVDPGLLEVTQGNNFKLRIYPVPPGGTRTVQFSYMESLLPQGGSLLYRLPLAFAAGQKLKDFSVSIKLHGAATAAAAAPQVSGSMGAIGAAADIRFERSGDGYQAEFSKSRYTPGGALDIVLPAATQAETAIQERDGNTYFVTEIPLNGASVLPAAGNRSLPSVIGLLWDSSGSGANRAVEAELNELDAYFKAVGKAEVRLTRLRDRPEAREVYKVSNGNWSALRAALQATVYDGASALNNWQPQSDVGEYLLFSDGLNNYGNASAQVLATGQRLYALNSSPVADTGRLAALAERSGGKLIQVSPQAPGVAAKELLAEGPRIVALSATGATRLQMESPEVRGGVLRIAGILQNPEAQLQLTLSQGGKQRQLTVPVSAKSPAHPLAAYLWASYRLHALEADYDNQRAEIRRLGQQFGIPSRETSLIVLESLADYARYDITPPEAYQKAYGMMKNLRFTQLQQERDKHLQSVVDQFLRKQQWWNTPFPKSDVVEKPFIGQLPGADNPMPRPIPVPRRMPAPPPPADPAPMPVPLSARSQVPAPAPAMVGQLEARRMRSVDAASDKASGSMKKAEGGFTPDTIGIALKKWTSDAPYIARMKAASADAVYAIYLDEKPGYANSSAFFLDAADMLFEKGRRDLGLRVLSNLAEMDLENRQVLRILGYRLLEANAPELAIPVFIKVQQLAEEEPQSWRDLGLAYAAGKQYQAAIDQLNEVVMRQWDGRFRDIEMISLAELNAIAAKAAAQKIRLDTSRVDPRLLVNMPLDVRAVMSWDADNSDMDLWVTDPNNEKCYYGHQLTRQGGHMSADVTQGYGPEEFSLRSAKPGKYKIQANFYGNRQQVVAGATTLQLKLTTGFGTPEAKDQMITLRLRDSGDTVFVGEFEVKPKGW